MGYSSPDLSYQPRDDAPRNLPPNPKDGAVVYVKGKDGTTTWLVYSKEYGAWVMPELIKAANNGDIEIELNEPVFGGAILLALPAGAVPGGQILLAGTAVVVGAIAIYNLAEYYHSYTPPPTTLPGFPNARRVKQKTGVKRWVNGKDILEWDGFHNGGEVEVYDKRGRHKGAFDPDTGEQTKPADPGRRTVPE